MSELTIDGVTYKTRRFETESQLWGGYTALRIGTTWRFLVGLRSANCVVIVTGAGFSMAASVWRGEDVRAVDQRAFGAFVCRTTRRPSESFEQMLVRLLTEANEKTLAEESCR